VNPAVFVAFASQTLSVLPSIVAVAQRVCVGLVRFATIGGPLVDVVDVADVGRNAATAVSASNDEKPSLSLIHISEPTRPY